MMNLADRDGDAFLPLDLQFTASVELSRDHAIVRFGGELDLASCELCRRYVQEISAVADGAFVFDLSRLSFLDCAGAVTLIESAERLSATRPVRFVIPRRGPVRRVFDLLGLGDVIPIDSELPGPIADSPSSTASGAKRPAEPRGTPSGSVRPGSRRSPIVIPSAR